MMCLTQNPEHILHDMVIRNTEITQHLRTELTRAEETIRTNQQEIWDMVSFIDNVIDQPLCIHYKERNYPERAAADSRNGEYLVLYSWILLIHLTILHREKPSGENNSRFGK